MGGAIPHDLGRGTVFHWKLESNKLTLLHSFTGRKDGGPTTPRDFGESVDGKKGETPMSYRFEFMLGLGIVLFTVGVGTRTYNGLELVQRRRAVVALRNQLLTMW